MRGWVIATALTVAAFGSGVGEALADCVSGDGAGTPRETVPLRTGEYRRAGQSLMCTLAVAPNDKDGSGSNGPPIAGCHHIGPLSVDMPLQQARELLASAPVKVQPTQDGRAEVHLIYGPDHQPIGYWVLYTDGERLTSIQETVAVEGWRSPLPHAFSSIHPGDPIQQALDVLGTPAKRCTGPGTVGEMWTWGPHGISMEMAKGRVYSIKIDGPSLPPSRGI